MKITIADYNKIKEYMTKATEIRSIKEHTEIIKTSGEFKDLDKRIRWDYFIVANRLSNYELSTNIYKYANDDHLDTALRKIMKELYVD